MSSTNKTSNYQLNSWIASDIPKREDFNNDNAIIDEVMAEHIGDSQLHVSDEDRNVWGNTMHIAAYTGNGAPTRVLETHCDFNPRFAAIFTVDSNLISVDFTDNQVYAFFALASTIGSSRGATLATSGKLTVYQETSLSSDNVYYNLNRSGKAYTVILFR